MGIITDITPQMRNKERCSIFVDGDFLCGISMETCIKCNLKKGMELDEDTLLQVKKQDDYAAALDRALSILEHGNKTEMQISQKLTNKGYDDETVQNVLVRLRELGYIDDGAYALRTVKQQSENMGRYAIKQKLLSKGIGKDKINSALDELSPQDELSAARQCYAVFLHKYAKEDAFTARRRISQALARRGFSWDIISEVMGQEDED